MVAIKLVIAEDDEVVALNLKFTLQDMGYVVLAHFTKGEALLQNNLTREADLVILDIDLPGELDGVEVATALQENNLPYIFLTAQSDQATIHRAKLTRPLAYLVKPFDKATLQSTIELAVYQHRVKARGPQANLQGYQPDDSIFVKARARLEKVKVKDVLWVEASDIYAELYTESGKYVVNYPLKVLEEKFPESLFFRVHRSFLVNLQEIEAIDEHDLIIRNKRVPIGKTYRAKLMARLEIM
jgi:DNA-binding LytR/AlgR family response regulator